MNTSISSGNSFSVRDYGASGNGQQLDTRPIQLAIDECAEAGGGVVEVPAGNYLIGTLFLKSNVTLHLHASATLLGSTDIHDYSEKVAPCGFIKEFYLDKCLIYAGAVHDVRIIGCGTIDGQGASFKGKAEGAAGGERPMLIRCYDSVNLVVEGVTLKNAAAWCLHFRECSEVQVTGVSIDNRVSWNNDGIDLMSTRNVRISDCSINCLDDAICFQNLSHEKAVENVVVTNCLLSTRWAAFRSGGAHRGGIRNVTVSNCVIREAYGCGIKLQISGNGSLENMTFSNIVMRSVSCPISLRFGNAHYHNDHRDPSFPWGKMRNLLFNNLYAAVVDEMTLRDRVKFPALYPGEERQCMSICGIPGHPIENVSLSDLNFEYPGGGTEQDARNLDAPELEDQYPEYFMWGVLPAYGLYARHARGVAVRNVRFELGSTDCRPPIVCDDVDELDISLFRAALDPKAPSLIRTRKIRGKSFQDCRALHGTQAKLESEF